MKLVHVLFFTFYAVCAERDIKSLVNKYVDWYNERSEESSQYVLPTDARMYEAENKEPQGRLSQQLNSIS